MIGYFVDTDCSFYDLQKLRARINEARILAEELKSKHNYEKYCVHVDFLEILELKDQLSFDKYDEINRPYFMQRKGDMRWTIRFKYYQYKRYPRLLKKGLLIKKLQDLLDELREDDTYKKIPYGRHLNFNIQ